MNDTISVSITGPAKIIGPATIPFQGGTAGFWIETTGLTGAITLRATCDRFAAVTLELAAV
jgi:beta-galactosidase